MKRSNFGIRAVLGHATVREELRSETSSALETRIAGAPISWGVCEVPGWGVELPPERVLSEMASLRLGATEAGPVGYLGRDADEIQATLARHGLRLVGGFLPVVLHDRAAQADSVTSASALASLFAAAGASVVVSAVVLDLGWSAPAPLSDAQWRAIWDGLARLDEAASEHGLMHVTHPHWGTLVAERDDVERLLEGSQARLCLDTGHLLLGGVDPAWLAAAAGERIGHVHLKDVAAETAGRLRSNELRFVEAVQEGLFRPLGTGAAPIADTIRSLERGGYEGWYVLEQDRALTSSDEGSSADVQRSIAFVQGVRTDGERKEGT